MYTDKKYSKGCRKVEFQMTSYIRTYRAAPKENNLSLCHYWPGG